MMRPTEKENGSNSGKKERKKRKTCVFMYTTNSSGEKKSYQNIDLAFTQFQL